ncbi:MAG TPA: hypothetical protein VK453_26975, partial [Micromonosporaceae bacterium]|nr:hypothetical protein [Micromonosporaceae bacterium]
MPITESRTQPAPRRRHGTADSTARHGQRHGMFYWRIRWAVLLFALVVLVALGFSVWVEVGGWGELWFAVGGVDLDGPFAVVDEAVVV